MTYTITVAVSEIAFPCEANETVLDAAERAGYALPYSCRKGVCDSCRGELAGGDIRMNRAVISGPADGVLLCRARPASDICIIPQFIAPRTAPRRKTLAAEIYRLSRAASDVSIVELRFPIGTRARFRAGQYLKVLFPDGDSRNYSLANDPANNNGAELHIRHIAGGRFSECVSSRLQPGDSVQVELPFGQFVMGDNAESPAVLLATGTGFGPLKSMILDQIRGRSRRPMTLYWGGRKRRDLYALELPQKWAARFPWFSIVPVLSKPDRGWSGRTGWVQNAALEDHPDPDNVEVYACGNPAMTAAAAHALGRRKGSALIHCDAFVASGETDTTTVQRSPSSLA